MRTVSLSGHCTRCAGLVLEPNTPMYYKGKICHCPDNNPSYEEPREHRKTGWTCSNCGAGNSPYVIQCPACAVDKGFSNE